MLDTATGQAATANTSTPNNAPAVQLPVDLRDWFAGQALAGDCASWTREDNSSFKVVDITERCYRLADAMLAARKAVQP